MESLVIACTECGKCNRICPTGVDVMYFRKNGMPVDDDNCVYCKDCEIVCTEEVR